MSQQAIILLVIFFALATFTYSLIYYDFKRDSAKKSAKK